MPSAPAAVAGSRPEAPHRTPLIDLAKVLASQCIVWHHLAVYGPMSDVVYPFAPGLFDWLYSHARLAVQVFLVIGGYLAARSLWPLLDPARPLPVPRLLWRRYLRLVQPYAVALVAAVLAAALARLLMDHPATPAAPTGGQLAAHLLLLQSVLGFDGLSAGAWYVAIDFQLFAVTVALVWAVRRWAGPQARRWLLRLCAVLTLASLAWVNRQPAWDAWAPYFFGAYGLGLLAWGSTGCAAWPRPPAAAAPGGPSRAARRWAQAQALERRLRWAWLGLAGAVLLALCIEWRARVLVAGMTALLLVAASHVSHWPRWMSGPGLAGLARISYAQFLVHYPVCLTMNALLASHWPGHPAMNALGLAGAWLLSLAAAAVFHRQVEQGALWRALRRRPAWQGGRRGLA